MNDYPQLLIKSFKNAWSQKSIWFLALVQIFCLFLVLGKLNPIWWILLPRAAWSVGLMLIFSMSSVILWLKIQAFEQKKFFLLSFRIFFQLSIRLFAFLALAVAFAIVLKVLNFHWTFFAVASSLAAVSFTVAMLAGVLYGLNFYSALGFMADFWRNKISILCVGAFTVMLGNAYAFYLAHAFWPTAAVAQNGGFSVFPASATIWIVFLVLAGIAAFFSTVLNAFLVLLFLDITRIKKDPEQLKVGIVQTAGNL